MTKPSAPSFHNRFPLGNTIGENAMPIALKKATTQEVQPNVNIPKINVKNGMAFDPFGSTFVKR